MITNGYITRQEFINRQGTPAAATYPRIDRHIEHASRMIDAYCSRKFYTTIETYDYLPVDYNLAFIDDLISVTQLSSDKVGNGSFDAIWASTDYNLEPVTARQMTPPRPYTMVRISPFAVQFWLSLRDVGAMTTRQSRSLRITGKWGFSDQTIQVTTLATGGIDASSTTLNVAAGTGSSIEVGHILSVESEQMFADSISTDAVTVRRGVNGTTAAAHVATTPISVFDFGMIAEACGLMAQRLYMRAAAPLGVQNANMFGTTTRQPAADPDYADILAPYRKIS
jgi:hypothetical protein